jgi:hypothetical protein
VLARWPSDFVSISPAYGWFQTFDIRKLSIPPIDPTRLTDIQRELRVRSVSLSMSYIPGLIVSNNIPFATISGPRRLVACLRYAVDDVVVRLATVRISLVPVCLQYTKGFYTTTCALEMIIGFSCYLAGTRLNPINGRHRCHRKSDYTGQPSCKSRSTLFLAILSGALGSQFSEREFDLKPVHKCQSGKIMIAPHRWYLMVFPSN